MSLHTGKILEIPITISPKEKILEEVKKYLFSTSHTSPKPLVIATPNPEQIVFAQKNSVYAKILKQADVTLPDGIGIVWAMTVLHKKRLVSRIPGVEFMQGLVQLANRKRVTIGLIGGTDGVAVKALECLTEANPGLHGWSVEPEDKTTEEIAEMIRHNHTRIVFVGLGAPKQELFIQRLSQGLSVVGCPFPVVLMSVGGSFDMISGKIQRAPVIIRNVGMEWLWRLFQQPWRWRRQLSLVIFALLVLKARLSVERTAG